MIQHAKDLIRAQLSQGTTPQALAKATAFGICIGNFPIFGLSTGICVGVAYVFRLNQPVLQVVNYMMSVSQLLMVPVFMYVGELMVGAAHQTLIPSEVFKEFAGDKALFFKHFGMAGLHAVIAWLVLAPIAGCLLYFITRPIYARLVLLKSSSPR